ERIHACSRPSKARAVSQPKTTRRVRSPVMRCSNRAAALHGISLHRWSPRAPRLSVLLAILVSATLSPVSALAPTRPVLAFAAAGQATTDTVIVFADASLAAALEQVRDGFEQEHPGTRVQVHLADASTLQTELKQGASADVLLAMDMATL